MLPTKKVKGRKRNALVNIDGRALVLQVGPASIPDRDGAVPLLVKSRNRFPFIERAFTDSAYAGDQVANATQIAGEDWERFGHARAISHG